MRWSRWALVLLLVGCGTESTGDGPDASPAPGAEVEGERPGEGQPPVGMPPGDAPPGGDPPGEGPPDEPPGEDPPEEEPPLEGPDCVPDFDVWQDVVEPIVADRCGQCHAEEPQFGAPFTLFDYDALVDGPEGERRVDRMADRIRLGTMPPANQPRPTTGEAMAILDWATCGADDTPPPGNAGGFDANRLPLDAPEEPPADTSFFDVRATDFQVPRREDHYQCFTLAAPVDDTRFIRRIEAVIDDARVVHHLVLLRAEPGTRGGQSFSCYDLAGSLYAWAPGMGPLEFEEGGLRLEPGEVLTIQIHYNNRTGVQAADASGVRIYHGEPEGPEVAVVALGPTDISVPPRSRGQAEGHCVTPHDIEIIASWPHMHEYGYGFEGEVVHRDGSVSNLISLTGWEFESQFVYGTPMRLEAGDRLVTRCEFRNPTDRHVGFGPGTGDEMCFNFMYHSPPMPWSICDQAPPADLEGPYEGGACLPDALRGAVVPTFNGRIAQGAAPRLSGGEAPDGEWAIVDGTLYLPTFDTPIGEVDPGNSVLAGQGIVAVRDGELVADFAVSAQVSVGGRVLDQPLEQSFAGEITAIDAGQIRVTRTCGGDVDAFRYERAGDRMQLRINVQVAGFNLSAVLELRALE